MQPQLIINPLAGNGKGRESFEKICETLKSCMGRFTVHLTHYPGEAKRLAIDAVATGSRLVIVCGGDGTINEVANGLFGSQTPLGIIPVGRGNDFAKALGIPTQIEAACYLIKKDKTRQINTISVGDRIFCSVAGMGISSGVNEIANKGGLGPGPLPYIIPVWQVIQDYTFPQIQLDYDDGRYEGEISLLAIANTAYYGGGMMIAPEARPDRDFLDIYVVEKTSKPQLLFNLPALFWGGHINKPFVKHFKSSAAVISSPHPLPIYADGEFFQNTPAEFIINPLSLNVITG